MVSYSVNNQLHVHVQHNSYDSLELLLPPLWYIQNI